MHSVWSCSNRGMCHYEKRAGKNMCSLYGTAWMTRASSFNIVDTGSKQIGNASKDKTMFSQDEDKIIWKNCHSASCQEVPRDPHPFYSFFVFTVLCSGPLTPVHPCLVLLSLRFVTFQYIVIVNHLFLRRL